MTWLWILPLPTNETTRIRVPVASPPLPCFLGFEWANYGSSRDWALKLRIALLFLVENKDSVFETRGLSPQQEVNKLCMMRKLFSEIDGGAV